MTQATTKSQASVGAIMPESSQRLNFVPVQIQSNAHSAVQETEVISNTLQRIEQSTPGRIVLDSMAAAGSEFATGKVANLLDNTATAAAIAQAYKTGGAFGATNQSVESGFVKWAGRAGESFGPVGGAAAAATATASFEFSNAYIAPFVAPTFANGMLWVDSKAFGGRVFGESVK